MGESSPVPAVTSKVGAFFRSVGFPMLAIVLVLSMLIVPWDRSSWKMLGSLTVLPLLLYGFHVRASLSRGWRTVFVALAVVMAVNFGNVAYRDVAGVLGIGLGSVSRRVREALELLRQRLGETA